MTPTRFDRVEDPGPYDATYTPSEAMLRTINGIAEASDLAFRFWAGMTLYVNMSTVFPCTDADEVVTSVVDRGIEKGHPTDGHYQLVLNEHGQLAAVAYEDLEPSDPDDEDLLVFETVSHTTVEARRQGLVRLAMSAALTEENKSARPHAAGETVVSGT